VRCAGADIATNATPNVIKDNPMVKARLFIFTSLIETQISTKRILEHCLQAAFVKHADLLLVFEN